MKVLADAWDGYRNEVIPPDASAAQLRESKRAFFGGAFALYTLIMVGLEGGDEATPDDLKFMENLSEELMEFYRRVKRGAE